MHPSHRILLNAGAALFDGGRYGEAIVVYKRYLADPAADRKRAVRRQIAKARKAIPGQARSDFDEGQARYIDGDYEGALLKFERAHAGMPHPGFLFNQASSLHKMGRYETASERYEMYLRDAPAAKDAARVRTAIDTIRSQPIPLGDRAGAEEYMKRGARLFENEKVRPGDRRLR